MSRADALDRMISTLETVKTNISSYLPIADEITEYIEKSYQTSKTAVIFSDIGSKKPHECRCIWNNKRGIPIV